MNGSNVEGALALQWHAAVPFGFARFCANVNVNVTEREEDLGRSDPEICLTPQALGANTGFACRDVPRLERSNGSLMI